MMLAAHRVGSGGRVRAATAWALTLAAPLLAGSPEALLMGGAASGALALHTAWPRDDVRTIASRVAPLGAGAALLAAGLSAGQWLPSMALASRSLRASLAPVSRSYWSPSPFALPQLLLPIRPELLPLNPWWSAELFESRAPYLLSLYVG